MLIIVDVAINLLLLLAENVVYANEHNFENVLAEYITFRLRKIEKKTCIIQRFEII